MICRIFVIFEAKLIFGKSTDVVTHDVISEKPTLSRMRRSVSRE